MLCVAAPCGSEIRMTLFEPSGLMLSPTNRSPLSGSVASQIGRVPARLPGVVSVRMTWPSVGLISSMWLLLGGPPHPQEARYRCRPSLLKAIPSGHWKLAYGDGEGVTRVTALATPPDGPNLYRCLS